MARPKKSIPAYCHHRPTGQGYVKIDGDRHYLGRFDDPATKRAYDKLVAEWLVNNRCLAVPVDDLTVLELTNAYRKHVEGLYTGRADAEKILCRVRSAFKPLNDLYGDTTAATFTPKSLLAVRVRYIATGKTRRSVNEWVQIVQRAFRWATVQELIPGNITHAIQAVKGLRSGESEAPESREISPVADASVDAIREHVSRQVWAMVELQRHTGMRPGEVCIMRGADLDTGGDVWVYRPTHHKNKRRGKKREVCLGPKSQEAVKPFLRAATEEYLFQPIDAERERYARCKWHRHQPVEAAETDRSLNDRYTTDTYAQAIRRACEAAKIPVWTPHRLRHAFATKIARAHGAEIARAMLGHASVFTTEIYVERDRAASATVALKIG